MDIPLYFYRRLPWNKAGILKIPYSIFAVKQVSMRMIINPERNSKPSPPRFFGEKYHEIKGLKMKKNFPRRLFLAETGAIIGFPALVLSCAAQDTSPTQRSDKSRVVTTRKDAILGQNNQLDFAAISSLIDKSICSLSDKKDPLDLWRSLFSPSDTVGIKLNTLGGRMLSPPPGTCGSYCRAISTSRSISKPDIDLGSVRKRTRPRRISSRRF